MICDIIAQAFWDGSADATAGGKPALPVRWSVLKWRARQDSNLQLQA
jgi:hypothetical protein